VNELPALFTRAAKLWRGAADEAMSRHVVRAGQAGGSGLARGQPGRLVPTQSPPQIWIIRSKMLIPDLLDLRRVPLAARPLS
jgi:hypothetical protein